MISIAIGLCGAPFFLSALWYWQTVGALLFLLHSIVDGCDGELARLRFQESRFGGILDFWGDNIVHVGIFACIAVGWALLFSRELGHCCSALRQLPEPWDRPASYIGDRCASGMAAGRCLPRSRPLPMTTWPGARCRLTSRFHLSRAYRCAVRQVELVSVCGVAGGAHIFFPSGISCSARAAAKQTAQQLHNANASQAPDSRLCLAPSWPRVREPRALRARGELAAAVLRVGIARDARADASTSPRVTAI